MKRNIEGVDVVVGIGMAATLFGGVLLYAASYGNLFMSESSEEAVPNLSINTLVQSKLQPGIGQSIVDQALLQYRAPREIVQAADRLSVAWDAAQARPPMDMANIGEATQHMMASHVAHKEYVMGKTIVNLTRQGVRSGAITADNYTSPHIDRIVNTVNTSGMMMDQAFAQTWQPRLGQWIVSGTQQNQAFSHRTQQRLGEATVQLAKAQYDYTARLNQVQNQFKALVAASERTEAQADRFAMLASAELNLQRALGASAIPALEVTQIKSMPELPFGWLLVAFVGLVSVFMIGFTLPKFGYDAEAHFQNFTQRVRQLSHQLFRKTG